MRTPAVPAGPLPGPRARTPASQAPSRATRAADHPHPAEPTAPLTLKQHRRNPQRPSPRAPTAGANTVTVKDILDAIQSPESTPADFAALPLPESYRAITVHKDETEMFAGMATRDKDPRKSIHLDEVPVPELGPGEALVAVMASSVNYNSVWTSIFEPLSTFGFLERYGRTNELAKRHDLPYHII